MDQPHRADPTELTTRQLQRELANLREVLEAKMTKTDALIELLQAAHVSSPDAITKEIGHLQRLHDEKFLAIQTQFRERDTRTEQTAKDSKVAVDAALQAAKEAVGEQNKSSALAIAKSETSTNKQLEQIGGTISAVTTSLNDKIDDVKGRLTTMDGIVKGGNAVKDDGRANVAIAVAAIAALLTVGSAFYSSHGPSSPVVYLSAPSTAQVSDPVKAKP